MTHRRITSRDDDDELQRDTDALPQWTDWMG